MFRRIELVGLRWGRQLRRRGLWRVRGRVWWWIMSVPRLGLGMGWRPELALAIERMPRLGFVELTAENVRAGAPLPPAVAQLCERGLQVIPHGISLNLGGAERLDEHRLRHLARLAQLTDAPFVSEHIAFVRAGGVEVGHLTPVPRTRASIEVLVENISVAKRHLPVPLALENIAALFDWPDQEMDDAAFVSEILERTDTLLLLDLSNLYANARNLHVDPLRFLDRVPLHRLAYVHMGGGTERDGVYHDTHAHPVPPGALELLRELAARVEPPGVMLERDNNYPPDEELNEEMRRIADAIERGRRTPKEALRA